MASVQYPQNVVWYIEARSSTAPRSAAQMGSAVVIWLGRHDDPTQRRKLLLTCRHVVRGTARDGAMGFGIGLGEYLCWQPGGSFTHPDKFNERRSGSCEHAKAAVVWQKAELFAKEVPTGADRRPALDWVLLDVQDPAFQDMPCITDLGTGADAEPLAIVGYPDGWQGWTANGSVESVSVMDFTAGRQSAPGTLKLSGNGSTAPGMSGGGVFNARGGLVGLHRAQTPGELSFGAVAADLIFSELAAEGWQVFRTTPDDLSKFSADAGEVGNGLRGLTASGQNPTSSLQIKNTLLPLKPMLTRLTNDLAIMQACKECHEVLLHRAEFKVDQLLSDLQDWKHHSEDAKMEYAVLKGANRLLEDARRFQDVAPRCASAYPFGPSDALDFYHAVVEVIEEVKAKSPAAARPVRSVMQRIISTTPSFLQEELSKIARQLPFDMIAKAIDDAQLDTSPGTSLHGLRRLIPLQTEARQFVNEHFAWQVFDKELRLLSGYVQSLLGGDKDVMPDIAYAAKRVLDKAQKLQVPESVLDRFDELLGFARQLLSFSGASNAEVSAVSNTYIDLQARADGLFTEADQRLLAACEKLTEIIQPLQQLLDVL